MDGYVCIAIAIHHVLISMPPDFTPKNMREWEK